MSSEMTVLLVGILAFFCFGLLFFLLIASIIVAAFIVSTRRLSRTFGEAGRVLGTDTATYFADAVGTLLPWDSSAWSDLSSHLEMSGIAKPGSVHYRGAIKSLSQPQERGWLVYEMRLKWRADGMLVLRTSAHALQLTLQNNSASSVQVLADGIPLGSLREQGGDIALFNTMGQPIGKYNRYRRKLQWRPYGVEDVEPGYGALAIGDRQLAEMNCNLIPNQYVAQLAQPIPALLRNVAPDVTSQEEDWLLALIGLEVYYRITRKVSDKRLRNLSPGA